MMRRSFKPALLPALVFFVLCAFLAVWLLANPDWASRSARMSAERAAPGSKSAAPPASVQSELPALVPAPSAGGMGNHGAGAAGQGLLAPEALARLFGPATALPPRSQRPAGPAVSPRDSAPEAADWLHRLGAFEDSDGRPWLFVRNDRTGAVLKLPAEGGGSIVRIDGKAYEVRGR